ncbi:mandelate racemase/muconate lactonizing enzyme family protein [Telmatospirillum siberiense]|uniref:O-succinylbenzoate synthase n=1 Tax=Telmatospirillum siberiense TaxID=382514 RepID=A0A2N3PMH5_9PROT|nr:enolase C-terminal domain-like protein [Telmatospirillum siberiense]PKU21594.1 o-succinylbenzoate synthase [Telmatospirillum siberiense]
MSRIVTARVVPYDLPLKRPWRMSGAEVRSRRGWLVVVETAGGLRGFGDYVLPPTQGEPAGEEDALRRLAQGRVGLDLALSCEDLTVIAPAGWAVECALLDAMARERNLPLCRLFDAEAPTRVAVNAVAEADGVTSAAGRGYRVIKMKVGKADPSEEATMLTALDLPAGIRLRLDANRAWSWDDASHFLDRIAGLPVESLEEPLREPTMAGLAALQRRTTIDLALDESLPSLGPLRVIEEAPVRRLVLKPAGLGGLRASYALASAAKAAGMTCVVTSALDSAVGVAAAAHLAAAVDGSGLAHGLATAEWLAADVAQAHSVRGGWMDLGGRGLGVTPEI